MRGAVNDRIRSRGRLGITSRYHYRTLKESRIKARFVTILLKRSKIASPRFSRFLIFLHEDGVKKVRAEVLKTKVDGALDTLFDAFGTTEAALIIT